MKNFQVTHSQCDIIIFHKNLSFESCKQLSDLCLADSRIVYFWHVLESIHTSFIELHASDAYLQGGLMKNKGGVKLFQISEKERLLISYDNQVLFGIISQCVPLSCTLQKRASSPLHFGQEENYVDTQLNGELIICFENCLGFLLSNRQSRNTTMNTFIIVNITTICKRCFRK